MFTDCGEPASVSRASNTFSLTTEGSLVTYTCVSGNIHIGGDLERVCQHDGQWSGSLPDCVPGKVTCTVKPVNKGHTRDRQHMFL